MVKKLKIYLYGIKFTVETDARSLLFMLNKPDLPNETASRWLSYLQLFDFDINHIKGENNGVADGLSRDSRDGHLFRRAKADRVPRKVVFDKDEQKVLLENIHTGIGGGHRGRDGTMAKLKDRYFWNKILKQFYQSSHLGRFDSEGNYVVDKSNDKEGSTNYENQRHKS
ncbi:Retrovirus-related Pol polyprotein from transposon [Smittium culicis]|uniref:Retrovirus-related Pol polyprotein from transposon n=1 Tax=Smittium culicis TaxID=133412 RepID=A0A1R1X0Z3_9FUNG|nr:Retrovirus-related Pol polyprotein from transposon [Smittium culicis]